MRLFRSYLSALVLTSLPLAAAAQDLTGALPQRVRVDCDRGQTLARALERFDRAPLRIELRGTCEERVTIARDDVEIVGMGESPTVRGSLTLQGVSRVALRSFTVRDTEGPDPVADTGDGIKVYQSQSVQLERLTVQDTGRRGFSIEQSSVDLVNLTTRRNGGNGLTAITSNLNFVGVNTFSDSQISGLLIGFGSTAFARTGARIVVSGNILGGFSLQNNSTMVLSNLSELVADSNPSNGIAVVNNSAMILGEGGITARNNVRGMVLGELSNLTGSVNSQAPLVIENNSGGGLVIFAGSSAQLGTGTRITGNGGTGLFISNALATLTGTQVVNNQFADVSLAFTARVIFQPGNVFSTPVLCDTTVVARGAPGCQASPTAAALDASAEPTF
jgi:Right handed beta helix region